MSEVEDVVVAVVVVVLAVVVERVADRLVASEDPDPLQNFSPLGDLLALREGDREPGRKLLVGRCGLVEAIMGWDAFGGTEQP